MADGLLDDLDFPDIRRSPADPESLSLTPRLRALSPTGVGMGGAADAAIGGARPAGSLTAEALAASRAAGLPGTEQEPSKKPAPRNPRRTVSDARFEALKKQYKPDLKELSAKLWEKMYSVENTGMYVPPDDPSFIKASRLSPAVLKAISDAGISPLGIDSRDFTPAEINVLMTWGTASQGRR